MEQVSIFDLTLENIEVNKPIRLIELFAGYGSQAMALERLGAEFEHYRVVEFDAAAVKSYNSVHQTNFPTTDVCEVHADDLGIVDKDEFTYLLTYSFPCTDISQAGQMKGFEEGSGTRSALLWEVKRILEELKESVSEGYQRGILKGVSRTLKANNHDACVVCKVTKNVGKSINTKENRVRKENKESV